MKIYNIEQQTDIWKEVKQGKISGTVAGSVMGSATVRKTALYDLVGERLSIESDSNESDMDRGNRLEPEARKEYEKMTGYTVEQVGFLERKDCKWIGISPDGLIKENGKYTRAIEIKCLCAKNHITAIEENEIPKKYYHQALQYFVVNPDLEVLEFVLYNPLLTKIPMFIFILNRKDLEKEIAEMLAEELKMVEEVNKIVKKYI